MIENEEFFDMDGNPIDCDTWSDLFEDYPRRVLAEDEHAGVIIRTMWFGHDDTRWFGALDGPPQIFGTALDGKGSGELETYATKEEALAGHAKHLATLRAQISRGASEDDSRLGTDAPRSD